MTVNVLFSAAYERWDMYEPHLTAAFAAAGLDAHLGTDIPAEDVDYIVYEPNGDLNDFSPFIRAKACQFPTSSHSNGASITTTFSYRSITA